MDTAKQRAPSRSLQYKGSDAPSDQGRAKADPDLLRHPLPQQEKELVRLWMQHGGSRCAIFNMDVSETAAQIVGKEDGVCQPAIM